MSNLDKIRHSAAHILADAIMRLYPKAKLAIGPSIEEGFYYDIDNLDINEEDLKKIEKLMKKIIKENHKFEEVKLSRKEAEKKYKNNSYKLEILKNDIKGSKISFHKHGEFLDMCKGGHVSSTGKIKAVKLLRLAGAYWRGDSKNKQLLRIYGTAFPSKEGLKEFLRLREEAEKRDHKKIGREMGIFMLHELVGKGLPMWLPRGEILKREIENYAIQLEEKHGYVRVSTPHIAKKELYEKSGHLPYYEDTMYPKMKMDDGDYYLKAMNCPHHHLIFNHELRSYRDLPIRMAEYGTVYRNELSGVLSGLLRVRMLSMNDAHIYCRKDQIEEEIANSIKLVEEVYKTFNFKDYWFRLSLGDPKNKKKYVNDPKNWKETEKILRNTLKKLKVKYVEEKDEAAFYGPKIDVQFRTVTGREESMSTIQLDFAAMKRFNFRYFDKNGKENKEVFVIHRAPLSTHERFVAFLLENCAGNLQLWLNPLQIKILTLTSRNVKYGRKIYDKLKEKRVRVELDDRSETMNKKVRDGQLERVNYLVTVGDKEEKNNTLAVRTRDGKVKFGVKVDSFIKDILKEIKDRK